ncbi:hypothetical protein JCM10450v2_007636 [Rhodotorula kratochvilovae]
MSLISTRAIRAPPLLLRLPPLPVPPRDALALLDDSLLPTSLPPPSRLRSHSDYSDATSTDGDDVYPRTPPVISTGTRPARTSSAGWAAPPRGQDSDDAWEDDGDVVDSPAGGEEEVGELVILSKHPGLVKQETDDSVSPATQHEVQAHEGVLVAYRRGTVQREADVALERMPLATRIGMRLLYHGIDRGRVVNSKRAERVFKRWSIREGRKFDDPHHAYERIMAFVKAYDIDCSQLREMDLRKYPTMNAFFSRRLAVGARPPASPNDPTVISSAADCRVTVFSSVADAQRLWIKGKRFTLPSLLQDPSLAKQLQGGAVAIFRLAVEDYHRFHSPVDAVVGGSKSVPGAYFTVNSMIVRDPRFDVFTSNKRDITTLLARHPHTGVPAPVAYVQVGALLVASIRRTAREGKELKRGDELGYFGLLRNSEGRNVEGVQVETLVKVGEKIGRWVDPSREA